MLTASALFACGSVSPSASGVFPAQGFTGRTLRVEISGDATSWQEGATVSFGDDVTVNSVDVASPTDLFATISIAPTATLGLRDVTVHSGGTFTLKQAFELESPVELAFVGGTDQGGFPAFTINGRDFDSPFDTTSDDSGTFINLSVAGPPGTRFQVFNATAYQITGFVTIDTDAMPGPVTIASDQVISVTQAMDVKNRAATMLPSGTDATGAISAPNDTALYTLTAAGAPSLVHVAVSSTDASASPLPHILGGSGHWSDQLGKSWAVLPTGAPVYVVVFDAGSAASYTFDISAAGEMLTSANEGNDTANNTPAGALVATALPFAQATSSMASASDIDYVKFTALAGKRVHVVTTAGTDPATDTQVDVLGDTAGTTSFTPDGGPENHTQCGLFGCSSMGEDFVSNPLPAGDAYIAVSAGPNYLAQHKSYVLLFWLE